jgi:hypothetical protein
VVGKANASTAEIALPANYLKRYAIDLIREFNPATRIDILKPP